MKRAVLLMLILSVFGHIYSQNSIRIAILDEQENSESMLYLDELKNNIRSVLGEGIMVSFDDVLYNNNDRELADKNYNALLNSKPDIIISFGVINTIMFYQNKSDYPIPTIIVGAINNDFIDIPKDKLKSEVNNITYLLTPFSYKEDLDVFKEISNFENIGIVVDEYLLNLLPLDTFFEEYFKDLPQEYALISLNKDSQVTTLFDGVDAVYLVSDNSIPEASKSEMIQVINQRKIPSLSGYGVEDVKNGVLASNQPETNFEQIFRRVALNVEWISNGTNAADLPLHINYNKQLSINMSTANEIGFTVKNSMLAKINLIEGNGITNTQNEYALLDIMKGVVDSNLALSAEKQNIKLSEQDVKGSKSQYLPDVTANATGAYVDPKVAEISNGQSPEFTTAGNITLNQVIYSEQASANIDIQKNILESQKESYNAAELDALLNASIAYYNALILKTNLSIQIKNLQMTKHNLEIANQNLEVGVSGKSDVLRFRSQLAQNTQGMIEARNSLSQAYYQINQLLNRPIKEELAIKDTIINTLLENADSYQYLIQALDDPIQQNLLTRFFIDEAKRNSPELKNIAFNIEATKRNFRLNDKGRFIPTVALQGEYNHTFSRSGAGTEIPIGFPVMPDGYYNLGLNIALPIFQQNTRNINRQTATIQQDQLNLQKQDIDLSIDESISEIVLELINELSNIEISKADLEFSKESLELSQNEYQNGAIPVIQLIDAQNNFFQARIANSTAMYNYRIVSMKLQRMLGTYFDLNSEAENNDFMLRAKQYILSQQ